MPQRSSVNGRLAFIGAVSMALVLLAACDARSPATGFEAVSCQQLMQPLVDALWGRGRQTAIDKFAFPVTVVHQQYDVRDSDPPYVLGVARTSTVATPEDALTLLAMLAARSSERDDDLVPRPRESEGTSWDSTFVEQARAANLRRCVITLDVGDTEHVLIAGFDSSGERIRAMYWN